MAHRWSLIKHKKAGNKILHLQTEKKKINFDQIANDFSPSQALVEAMHQWHSFQGK